jgi:hypothetical protein
VGIYRLLWLRIIRHLRLLSVESPLFLHILVVSGASCQPWVDRLMQTPDTHTQTSDSFTTLSTEMSDECGLSTVPLYTLGTNNPALQQVYPSHHPPAHFGN